MAFHGPNRTLWQPHDDAKWTVVTYLPFLWRPGAHMFLKGEVTTEFAARVGHRLADDYEPRLDIGSCRSTMAHPNPSASP
jgi:hypothetical protein